MKYLILGIFLSFSMACFSGGDEWTPRPNFSIEGSNYKETLTFISGISYALTYSNLALISQKKENFFCINPSYILGSKEIIGLLNKKLTGDYSSEVVINTLVMELVKEFPCGNQQSE